MVRVCHPSASLYPKVSHAHFCIPSLNIITTEPGDLSDDDDELEIGGATQTFKCPLTMTAYIEPVTSSVLALAFFYQSHWKH